MKKILVFGLSLLISLSFVISTEAEENNNEINIYDLEIGETIVLEENKTEGYSVELTLTDIEFHNNNPITLFKSGDSGWSGGTPPSGTVYYFRAEKKKGLGTLSFEYVLDTRGGYAITDAYNPHVKYYLRSITKMSLEIGVKKATHSTPARASLYWESNKDMVGIPVAMKTGYLTIQVSAIGRMRTTWLI